MTHKKGGATPPKRGVIPPPTDRFGQQQPHTSYAPLFPVMPPIIGFPSPPKLRPIS